MGFWADFLDAGECIVAIGHEDFEYELRSASYMKLYNILLFFFYFLHNNTNISSTYKTRLSQPTDHLTLETALQHHITRFPQKISSYWSHSRDTLYYNPHHSKINHQACAQKTATKRSPASVGSRVATEAAGIIRKESKRGMFIIGLGLVVLAAGRAG